jgi:acyl carrier protein phosphodiesterase
MKKLILLLVMIATAVTAYNQSSRRTANTNTTTRSERSHENQVNASSRNREANRTVRTSNNNPKTVNHHVNRTTARRNTSHVSSKHVHYRKPARHAHKTVYHTYRSPVYVDVVWNRNLHRHYVKMYPAHRYWRYEYGYRISSIPAYNAEYYVGDIKTVYGRVSDVFYSHETDEYFLSFGPGYPYQHFTVIVPGHIARSKAHRPGRYFMDRHVKVQGLITTFEGRPEIIVKRNFQINVY